MLYVNYSSINLGKKRKWYLVEVREVCAMGIYPISCQKKYIEEELPSRLLNSQFLLFLQRRNTALFHDRDRCRNGLHSHLRKPMPENPRICV